MGRWNTLCLLQQPATTFLFQNANVVFSHLRKYFFHSPRKFLYQDQYAVNEIYARHGLKFTKKVNKERFEKKAWYNGTVDDQDSISLNKYEKKNVDTMAAELKKRGLR